MSNDTEERTRLYSAMNTGNPYKSYKKTIIGKVFVTVLDQFSDTPTGVILEGDPKKGDMGTVIDVWSEKEDVFFRRMNFNHLNTGTMIPYSRVEVKEEKKVEQSTDEELKVLLSNKFFALQSKINGIDTIPVLARMLDMARDMGKSEKITKLIEARITEIQNPEPLVTEE